MVFDHISSCDDITGCLSPLLDQGDEWKAARTIHLIDSMIVSSLTKLKSRFRFQMTLLLEVCALDASDPPMVGYLLELFWESPLAGPTILMERASMAGFQQALPMILGQSSTESRSGIVGVFCTGKIQGGQDHAFQFRGGLVNYKAHDDLS
jgi:hypothetical protein